VGYVLIAITIKTTHGILIMNSAISTPDVSTDIFEEIGIDVPKIYNVILHNDDVTTFDFVVSVLLEIFEKTVDDALEITLYIHTSGKGVAGSYTFEIAEFKAEEVINAAAANGFPLKVTLEEAV
jgi:ATP-dependent Clp protease adaptor protein ClpS